ncbi:hypothetical protein ASG43_00360 [Aureimonas sp. Leaf454]|uniref:molybdenum cofactor guanylyltransferase n=1 Tax=Aureimonas sp. Leaf454 TaxID=1736381 RepID=UPI0006F537E0|nr:molybdenum cofactor guanylyltransferase [Aureimonas sp. Leaf454]KQT54122.1 hypothetical protein ASG43_00360 [Aureimonas sp. Leaf454]
MKLAAMLLAGGRGSRMGGDVPKPLVELAGRPLLAHVLQAVPAEVDPVILNTFDSEAYGAFGLPSVADRRPGFAGPLAGIEAVGLSPCLQHAGVTHLLVLPGDTPFLTRRVVEALIGSPGPRIRVARHRDQLQPTVALWPMAALQGLSAFLDAPRRHAIRAYLDEAGHEPVDIEGDDPFFNVNTPADLAEAERRWSAG